MYKLGNTLEPPVSCFCTRVSVCSRLFLCLLLCARNVSVASLSLSQLVQSLYFCLASACLSVLKKQAKHSHENKEHMNGQVADSEEQDHHYQHLGFLPP